MGFPLTDEQKKIVDDRDGQLLISAAAGSGKTRVLVERLLDRVTESGADIDRFLVITYTKAAAAELRGRIAQELSARLAENPGDRHLRRQTTLVYQTQISTIHAFCGALLRESGHSLDLDPDFRLCDEGDSKVLMAQTLEQVLDKRYEGLEEGSPFAQLADTLGAGRDDSRLASIVLDIYNRIQSHPDPERWLREEKEIWDLEGLTDLSETDWGKRILTDCKKRAAWCQGRIETALLLAGKDELLSANYLDSLDETRDSIRAFLNTKTWDEAAAALPIAFPAAGRKKKRKLELAPDEELEAETCAKRMKSIREGCKKQMEKVGEQMGGSSAELLEELSLSVPAVYALMDLVADFQTAYAQEKRNRSLVDFSDLEHFSVRLLLDEQGEPTPLAGYWSARYDEILVDEYQDTNQVQNAIFTAISDGGRKLFQVGDVKQSIYRFRLADPTIFLDKYRSFKKGDEAEPGEPRTRVLSRNFRSRKEVLLGCNDLFSAIMSTELGELDYVGDQLLVPGPDFPENDSCALELNALDLSFLKEQEGEKENKDLVEARFVARRIRQLLSQPMMVTEGDGLRPIRPSDIMILVRSPGVVLRHYIQAMGEENIPWTAEGGSDLFESTEINVALSILQIVDNPRQDVALIAALRSPVYGFSEDKLALLRGESRGDFYSTLVAAAEKGDRECEEFLNQLAQLRFGAGDMTCRQLIWHIYEKTNILGIFGAMNAGAERQNNLLALYSLAGQMEQAGCQSLFKFLLRLERLRENNAKLTVTDPGREGEGVSILSIHRSKGLEKPVVLLCGLTRQFNREDFKGTVLFHPKLGVGPKGLDRDRMVEYPTVARRAVSGALEQEMLSEELRLLYVAMTRAKDKLILSMSLTGGEKDLTKLGEDVTVPLSPMHLREQPSMGHWILLHALTRSEAKELRELAGVEEENTAEHDGPDWDIRWVFDLSLMEPSRHGGVLTDLPEEEGENLDLKEALTWVYPHAACVDLPSKLTATQMKGRPADKEVAEDTQKAVEDKPEPIYRPDFVAEHKGLTAAQKGTALHMGAQYIPLDGDHSAEGIAATLDRLTEEQFLTPLQREAIKPRQLSDFFESDLGREMCAAPTCRREFKFSILAPASDYYPGAEGEEVLFQGVIDAWFENEKGVTVLDFKSDHIRPGGEKERGEGYRPQLESYGMALSRILGKPVTRKVLWFFSTGTAYDL